MLLGSSKPVETSQVRVRACVCVRVRACVCVCGSDNKYAAPAAGGWVSMCRHVARLA